MGLLYWIISSILTSIAGIFFRNVESNGEDNIPKDKSSIIFVAAPHANQFIDPIILLKKTKGISIGFLIAEKSLKRKFVGTIAKGMNSIGVPRPQDYARKVTGTISAKNTKVIGTNTLFTQEIKLGESLAFKGNSYEVKEILSDTEITLKNPIEGEEVTNISFKVIPKLDQSALFNSVWKELANGKNIGIFPEGGSHDRVDLLPLKAGFAIMALGAMDAYPGLKVKLVPCGLNYFAPHKFRSSVFVDFGKPIEITEEMVEKYRKGGAEKRDVISDLIKVVDANLRLVTVTAPTLEVLYFSRLATKLYSPENRKLTIFEKAELNRRFAKAYEKFKDHPKVVQLRSKADVYIEQLKAHGLSDDQVSKTSIGPCRSLFVLLGKFIWFLILFLMALPGLLINIVPAIIIDIKSKQKAKEALQASTVKVAGNDVVSTWKLLIGLGLLPLNYLILSALASFFILYFVPNLPLYAKILIPIGCLLFCPLISYMSVRFFEIGIGLASSFRSLLWSILGRGENLRKIRSDLALEVRKIVDELGPQMFGYDFENQRIVSKEELVEEKGGILIESSDILGGQFHFEDESTFETNQAKEHISLFIEEKK